MKIAFLVGDFPSLSETFILSQITELIDCGHQVDIYAQRPCKAVKVHESFDRYHLCNHTFYHPDIPGSFIYRYIKAVQLISPQLKHFLKPLLKTLNVLKYKRSGASLRLFYRAIPFLERRQVYDVIHCHHGTLGLMGLRLKDIGVVSGKLVTSFHGYDVNVIPEREGHAVYSDLFQGADILTVNSTFTALRLFELGCPQSKVVRLPVGLDVSQYLCRPRHVQEGQTIKIITVARLVEKKGLEYSIRAVSQVVSTHPNVEYNIVGDGPLRTSLQKIVEAKNLQSSIHFLGWKTKEEVQDLYDQSHIFVLSSVTAKNCDREGQGLVLAEAQAMGLPVVATLHNGFPDSVLDGQSAYLVPEKDVDALAERIAYLVDHPSVWSAMGQKGRQYVEENFDIRTLNRQLIEIYRQC